MTDSLSKAAKDLSADLQELKFGGDVHTVYDPLQYAWERHCEYLERFGSGKKRVLFLGMNPGPYGMAQTGVPFGEIPAVRDWMGIEGAVSKPEQEHPKRPIDGFACTRSEVSGRRLWGLFAEKFGSAEKFFEDHFVSNFCPLVWMGETGKNITPDKISKTEMKPVEEACANHLKRVIELLNPEYLIGVGAFAQGKLKVAHEALSLDDSVFVGRVLHPSPASPAANRGWAEAASKQMEEQNIW